MRGDGPLFGLAWFLELAPGEVLPPGTKVQESRGERCSVLLVVFLIIKMHIVFGCFNDVNNTPQLGMT